MEAFSAAMAEQIKKEGYSLLLFSCQKNQGGRGIISLISLPRASSSSGNQSLSSERMMVLGCSRQPGSELWHFRGGRSDWPWFSATQTQLPCWSSGTMAEPCAIHKQHAGKRKISAGSFVVYNLTQNLLEHKDSLLQSRNTVHSSLWCVFMKTIQCGSRGNQSRCINDLRVRSLAVITLLALSQILPRVSMQRLVLVYLLDYKPFYAFGILEVISR